jgi:hypothetical protein
MTVAETLRAAAAEIRRVGLYQGDKDGSGMGVPTEKPDAPCCTLVALERVKTSNLDERTAWLFLRDFLDVDAVSTWSDTAPDQEYVLERLEAAAQAAEVTQA